MTKASRNSATIRPGSTPSKSEPKSTANRRRNRTARWSSRRTPTENPLHEELKSTPNSTLTLKPNEWIDRHEQTYYTYYLRPDVTWSDGAPFTTQDLEFAYAVLNNPTVDGDAIRVYYQDLVECKALSPQVVRMRYRQQYFKAFEFTAGMASYTPPWHLYVQKFDEQGQKLTLEKLTPEEESQQNKISAMARSSASSSIRTKPTISHRWAPGRIKSPSGRTTTGWN